MKRPIHDTLSYLKNFEVNKMNYIGKPFSVLFNILKPLKPQTAKSTLQSTVFKFSNNETLLIEWQENLLDNPIKYFEKNNSFRFTTNEKNYYDTKIVKGIQVN